MSTPVYPRILWTGVVQAMTLRVVDLGPGHTERLIVEIRNALDAMGAPSWGRYEPIPRDVFQQMLVSSGVIQ